MRKRIKQTNIDNLVEVINTALILTKDQCDGLAIPAVILNTENVPIVEKAIEAHKSMQGEMKYQWGFTIDYKYAILEVQSIVPIKLKFSILFDLDKFVMVIDRIIETQLLIIQAGKPGDTMATTMNNTRILVEVPIPEDGFKEEWRKIREKIQKKQFKKLGIKRKDCKEIASIYNKEWNSIVDRHFK